MDPRQLEELEHVTQRIALVGVQDLSDKTPRTLLLGATRDGFTRHVYLGCDGQIHCLHYRDSATDELLLSHHTGPFGGCRSNADYLGVAVLYPESCDAQFCQRLIEQGETLPFDAHSPERGQLTDRFMPYAGKTFARLAAHRAKLVTWEALDVPVDADLRVELLLDAFASLGLNGKTHDQGVYVREADASPLLRFAQALYEQEQDVAAAA
jgi:hypothetical protein